MSAPLGDLDMPPGRWMWLSRMPRSSRCIQTTDDEAGSGRDSEGPGVLQELPPARLPSSTSADDGAAVLACEDNVLPLRLSTLVTDCVGLMQAPVRLSFLTGAPRKELRGPDGLACGRSVRGADELASIADSSKLNDFWDAEACILPAPGSKARSLEGERAALCNRLDWKPKLFNSHNHSGNCSSALGSCFNWA